MDEESIRNLARSTSEDTLNLEDYDFDDMFEWYIFLIKIF